MSAAALTPRIKGVIASSCSMKLAACASITEWPSGSEHLPLGLLPLALSKAKSGATTIFVNELDAGSFKCPSNDLKGCTTRLARSGF